MNECSCDADPWHLEPERCAENAVACIAVYRPHVHCVTCNVRRPIRTTDSVIVRHASDTAGDDKGHVSQGPAGVQQFERVGLHGLDTEPTPAPTSKLTRAEVLHGLVLSRLSFLRANSKFAR